MASPKLFHTRLTRYLLLLMLMLLTTASPAVSQETAEAGAFKGYTLVKRVTDYDQEGRALPAFNETLYVSARGDWRYVGTYPNGQTVETIYLCGMGVYVEDQRKGQLVKFGEAGEGRCARRTDAQLQSNPKFIRTEQVLGRLAYLERDTRGYVEETYFVPELGHFPFKRISYLEGYRRVEEPVSLTFGEPEAAQLRGADYPLAERKPVYDANLSARIEEKPEPTYPPEARAHGISGEVDLQVILDESGHVIRAVAINSLPLLTEHAIEAAYKARFAPTERKGRPVRVTGIITYRFPAL